MLRLPPEAGRSSWFRDIDGVTFARQKLEDEILNEVVDFTDQLEAGEAIAIASWDDVSGPTISGTAVASPRVSFTVRDSGEATLVVRTATRTLRRQLRWIAADSTRFSDYR